MPEDRESTPPLAGPVRGPRIDRAIADVAARQHGVAARRQLVAAGLTAAMLDARIASGHLVRLHSGVYAVGHERLRWEGLWLAAVLAAGPGAVLSHRDAAALHGLRPANGARTDVSTAAERRDAPGIRVHKRCTLSPADVTRIDAIPVTTVARTIVDLAAILPRDHLGKVLSEAERLRKLDVGSLVAALARTRGRRGRGHRALKTALAEHARHGAQLTRSELEDRFHALLDAQGIPRPLANASIRGIEVDAYWPAHGLVVELDGYAFHRGVRAFQRDREQTNALTIAGYLVLRFTHADVTLHAEHIAEQIRNAIAERGPRI